MNGGGLRAACVVVAAALLLAAAPARADLPLNAKDLQCPDAEIFGKKLITGVCWSCMFPVYLSGFKMFDGRVDRPAGASNDRVCYCSGDLASGTLPTIGFTVGMFMPTRLVELVRKPYCFPSLFGADMGDAELMDGAMAFGGSGRYKNNMDAEAHSLWTWHLYAFPLMEIMELLNLPQCNTDNYSTFDLMFMSEAFPNWYDSQLAFLVNPEAMLFGNPVAQAAGLADCAAASVDDPLNSVFWMAGCWGSHYPLTGTHRHRLGAANGEPRRLARAVPVGAARIPQAHGGLGRAVRRQEDAGADEVAVPIPADLPGARVEQQRLRNESSPAGHQPRQRRRPADVG